MKLRTLIFASTIILSCNVHAASQQQINKELTAYSECMEKSKVTQMMIELNESKKFKPQQDKVKKYCAQNQLKKAQKEAIKLYNLSQKDPAFVEMHKCLKLAPNLKKILEAEHKKRMKINICEQQKKAEELGKALEQMDTLQ